MGKTFFLLAALSLMGVTSNAMFGQVYRAFSGVTGEVWNDTSGKPIQAHGGQVQKFGDKWWWIGEDKADGYRTQNGISVYSSNDLYNWTFEAYALRAVKERSELDKDPYFTELYGHLSEAGKDSVYEAINTTTSVIERPKMIYNARTGKYVIWFHADGPLPGANSDYAAAAAGVAIGDSPKGPFRFIKRSRLHQLPDSQYGSQWYEEPNNRGFARDMNLFVDDDQTAYIIYSSEENRTMFISRLNDEYTDLDVPQTPVGLAVNGRDFVRLYPGRQREAPAMFKYHGKYYMMTSGATGWDPNRAEYWTADSIFGEWTVGGDPCVSQSGIPYPANLTFRTQSTNIIPYDAANGKFIYMGDRWNSGNLGDSRYVWLPVYLTPTGEMELHSMGEWDLNLLDTINLMRYGDGHLADLYFRNGDLPVQFAVEVNQNGEWKPERLPLKWEDKLISQLPPAAPTAIRGTFTYRGGDYEVEVRGVNVPEELLYFVDCGAVCSDLHDSICAKGLAPMLVNRDTCDAPFTEERGWGYTGVVGTEESGADIDYKNKDSRDSYTSGWFAWADKTIDYKLLVANSENYRLTVGFQEWWNTLRGMRIFLKYENTEGTETERELGEFRNNRECVQDYSFRIEDLSEQNPYITVGVEKTTNPDPILSWLALGKTDYVENLQQQPKAEAMRVFVQGRTVVVETPQVGQLRVTDMAGRVVLQVEASSPSTGLDLQGLPVGMFLVEQDGGPAPAKIVLR